MAKEKFRDLEVSGRIKEIRERILGWSRERLGEALRDSPNLTGKLYGYDAIRRWEEEGRIPDAAIIREIAHLGKVSTDYILGMPDNPTMCPRHRQFLTDLKSLISKYEATEGDHAAESANDSDLMDDR